MLIGKELDDTKAQLDGIKSKKAEDLKDLYQLARDYYDSLADI